MTFRTRSLSTNSLPLDFFQPPLLGRAGFEQKLVDKSPFVINDDVVRYSLVLLRASDPLLIQGSDFVQHSRQLPVG